MAASILYILSVVFRHIMYLIKFGSITEKYWPRAGVEPRISRLTYEHSTIWATSIIYNFAM